MSQDKEPYTSSSHDDPMHLSTLLLSSVLQLLRDEHCRDTDQIIGYYLDYQYYIQWSKDHPRHLDFQYVNCAGSNGYAAFKEMLQSGIPGHSILLESHDLRTVTKDTTNVFFRLVRGDERWNNVCDEEEWTSDKDGNIPAAIEHLAVFANEQQLPPYFLQQSGLKTIDLSHLSYFTIVPRHFLGGCSGLVSLDLSPLSHLTELPHAFLSGCTGLTSLDLSPLSNLTELPSDFLMNCTGLVTLDLGPFSHLTTLPMGFLPGCSGLKSLDLSPLTHLISLSYGFLYKCTGLVTLDLSPLFRIKNLPGGFLSGCTGLTSLDLSPLSSLTELPSDFLLNCTGLVSLDMSPLSHLTPIVTKCG